MRYLTSSQILAGERLTDEELRKMSTARLFQLFRHIRACANPMSWGLRYRCCEICKEWIGSDEKYQEHVVKPSQIFADYEKRIKAELNTRPDQFSHRNKKRKNRKPKTVKRKLGQICYRSSTGRAAHFRVS